MNTAIHCLSVNVIAFFTINGYRMRFELHWLNIFMLVNGFAGIQIIQCYLNLVSAESLEVNLFYESPLHFILPYKSRQEIVHLFWGLNLWRNCKRQGIMEWNVGTERLLTILINHKVLYYYTLFIPYRWTY